MAVPGEPGYDDAVNIWNGAITKRPSVVCRCTTDADVAAALLVARSNGLEVSVRGGGHNYGGFALAGGGLMIDLTPMKTVTVDVGTAPAVPAGCVLAHGWPPGPVFLERVPGSLARLGVWDGVSPRVDLHSPHFMVDERAVAAGIRLMAHTALAALQH